MKERRRYFLPTTGLLLTGFLLTGCALTKDYVSLSYTPQPDVRTIEGANKVSVEVSVSDMRTIRDQVGAKKNGYGMEMAPIISTNDVATILQSAIEIELKDRGFQVATGDVVVTAELSRFYNDFKVGFWAGDAVAEVTMSIQVKNAEGSIIFTSLIEGKGIKRNIQLASGKNAKIALDAALQDAVAKLFNEPTFVKSLVQSAKPVNAALNTLGSR